MQLSEQYLNKFDSLLCKVAERDHGFPLTAFWPLAGLRYWRKRKLMVIGRAVNGWQDTGWSSLKMKTSATRCRLIEELTEHEAKGMCPMSWLPRCIESGRYNANRSAFWRLIRNACNSLCDMEDDWYSRICWTNLFKVSPFDGGNPSGALLRDQIQHSVELLKMEISEFRPELVLVFTGMNWFDAFAEGLQLRLRTPKRSTRFVQRIGEMGGRTWIIGKHPQGKPEVDYLQEITGIANGQM